ncbi:hypothetical protein KAFR_0G03480 [Kazachstania africana CBS 2517]|uniref:RNA helicase n=1 Tax=Kazachstania africana (strain ATCC 22294 / BCRC 22015 / CBS 2517 / CECT 1963 / NBRC 1671 / NRRL Y-8276) TaxID=1071382 RepID=H2AYD0_KAZAF|nr:hypothetical protein KAFR_0G03480 [Kazachstania africana CBS 2517]CCF59380.1 hypothetical protein KAFR_0G03480 [Kazachstania africana CBS 2517]
MTNKAESFSEKDQLLKERRAKLAKWKQKKAQFDLEKKQTKSSQPEVNESQITNIRQDASAEDKLAARRKRLEEWKSKKRNISDVNKSDEPKNKRPKKTTRIEFEDSDTEISEPAVALFRPDSISGQDDADFTLNRQYHDDVDPLDALMNGLTGGEDSKGTTSRGDVLDETTVSDFDDSDIVVTDDEFEAKNFKRIARMKSLKKVTEVKYDKNNLEPFQKVFYQETPEIRNMTADEVSELRLNLDNIKIKGHGCPNPITRWSQLGLNTSIMNSIKNVMKFQELTPIQAQALPAIMSGRDVIGISKTGSGKTISYLLPLLRQVKSQRDLSNSETGPIGLVLAPTRELALQIHEEINKLINDDASLNCICCTGGSELKDQISSVKRGVKIVVATPGRFIDLLTINSGKLLSTGRITFVVMDEADRLFDMGFEPQVTQIMKAIRPDKQCVLFSATFSNKIRSFAMRVLKNPITITINSNNIVNENVSQNFRVCESDTQKFDELISLLKERNDKHEAQEGFEESDNLQDNKTIIFVASQQICDILETNLVSSGFEIFSIHAGKPYQERVLNLEKYRRTRNSLLLCTEVLSRGLNVPEVSLVIIYNAVKTFAQYIHTTGRTARGNSKGKAVSFLLKDELAAAYILKKAMREHDFENQDPLDLTHLNAMNAEFEKGMNSGQYKLFSGFGGKGLENMDTKREKKEQEEKLGFENNIKASAASEGSISAGSTSKPVNQLSTDEIQMPKLEHKIVKTSEVDGSVVFSAEVYVNDLPQLVRWEATKNTTLMFVKHETGCSITNKGKFYPEGSKPKNASDEPKLYLLIEGHEEKSVKLSIELLETKVKEGIKKIEYQTIKSNKY